MGNTSSMRGAVSMGDVSWIGIGSEHAFREGPETDFDRPLVALTFFAGTSDYTSALLLPPSKSEIAHNILIPRLPLCSDVVVIRLG